MPVQQQTPKTHAQEPAQEQPETPPESQEQKEQHKEGHTESHPAPMKKSPSNLSPLAGL